MRCSVDILRVASFISIVGVSIIACGSSEVPSTQTVTTLPVIVDSPTAVAGIYTIVPSASASTPGMSASARRWSRRVRSWMAMVGRTMW